MPVNSLTLCRLPGACLLALGLLGLATQASSQVAEAPAQSMPAVRKAAESALRRQLDPAVTGVVFEAAELDSRLRLAACSSPLAVDGALPRGTQARVMVRVACKGNVYWSLNVPVDLHHQADVLVMRRAVGRGENIAAGDVLVQSRVLPGLTSPYVSRPADLAGRLTRRPIPAGTAVSADALDAALLIHRGQSVVLAARAGGLEVRAPGVALADAAAEQRVRVRNLNSLKVIEGVADTEGVVRVTP
jgi:flagella basal body P-ring formation protein FlgA